jgi:hypothetical protein
MITDKKVILFGAGIFGRRALNFFGSEKVHCFVDNNKAGQVFWGKPIISFDELKKVKDSYDVVLTVNRGRFPIIEEQCRNNDIGFHVLSDLICHEDFKTNQEIQRYRRMYNGKRCFLIGNGPSLTADDLTTLHTSREISFACNEISKIFEYTPWRPTYYFGADTLLFGLKREELTKIEAYCIFIPKLEDVCAEETAELTKLLGRSRGKIHFINVVAVSQTDEIPRFSPDPSKAVYLFGTIMYPMIQFAVYMGFSTIVLIGVDGTTSVLHNPEEYLSEKRHFYNEDAGDVTRYCSHSTGIKSTDSAISITNAYQKAESYTHEYGVKILNATRGGKLEVFERVSFDSLF